MLSKFTPSNCTSCRPCGIGTARHLHRRDGDARQFVGAHCVELTGREAVFDAGGQQKRGTKDAEDSGLRSGVGGEDFDAARFAAESCARAKQPIFRPAYSHVVIANCKDGEREARITSIIVAPVPRSVRNAQRILLATLGAAAIAAPAVAGLLLPLPARAQGEPHTTRARSFDVASVKLSNRTFTSLLPARSGGRFSWIADLQQLIEYAYHVEPWRISGDIPDQIYAVEATTAPGTSAGDVRLMLQTLLVDRFKMSAHPLNKDVNGWALTAGKSGLKIKPVQDADPMPSLPEWFSRLESGAPSMEGHVIASIEGRGIGALTGRRVTITQLAEEGLQRVLWTAVVDETGLQGKYYFGFKFAHDDEPGNDQPTLFVALQETLGLKLEKRRVPVETVAVDHIEKMPTGN